MCGTSGESHPRGTSLVLASGRWPDGGALCAYRRASLPRCFTDGRPTVNRPRVRCRRREAIEDSHPTLSTSTSAPYEHVEPGPLSRIRSSRRSAIRGREFPASFTAVATLLRPVGMNRLRIAVSQAARWTVGSRMEAQRCAIIQRWNVEHFEDAAHAPLPPAKGLFVGRSRAQGSATPCGVERCRRLPECSASSRCGPQRTMIRRVSQGASERVQGSVQ